MRRERGREPMKRGKGNPPGCCPVPVPRFSAPPVLTSTAPTVTKSVCEAGRKRRDGNRGARPAARGTKARTFVMCACVEGRQTRRNAASEGTREGVALGRQRRAVLGPPPSSPSLPRPPSLLLPLVCVHILVCILVSRSTSLSAMSAFTGTCLLCLLSSVFCLGGLVVSCVGWLSVFMGWLGCVVLRSTWWW